MENIKYKINKIFKKIVLIFNQSVRYFYKNSNPEMTKIIKQNRKFLENEQSFLTKTQYEDTNYGIPGHIFSALNKKIDNFPTYSDLFVFMIKTVDSSINYLEIGVSVLKNFLQLNASLTNANLTGFDINPISPNFKHNFRDMNKVSSKFYTYSSNQNELYYFQGSVLDELDTEEFKKLNNSKFNFIFSDALHEPDAVFAEFNNLIKDELDENFILYYDDLDFDGLSEMTYKIFKELNKEHENLYFCTFYINGWIGQHEKLHKNGIISTIDFYSLFKKEGIKLPLLKRKI